MQLIFTHFQPIPLYFVLPADHITVDVVKTDRAQLIFAFLVVLLIVTLLMKDVSTVVADHPLVDGDVVIAAIADQITNMAVILNTVIFTIVCIIFFQV